MLQYFVHSVSLANCHEFHVWFTIQNVCPLFSTFALFELHSLCTIFILLMKGSLQVLAEEHFAPEIQFCFHFLPVSI